MVTKTVNSGLLVISQFKYQLQSVNKNFIKKFYKVLYFSILKK